MARCCDEAISLFFWLTSFSVHRFTNFVAHLESPVSREHFCQFSICLLGKTEIPTFAPLQWTHFCFYIAHVTCKQRLQSLHYCHTPICTLHELLVTLFCYTKKILLVVCIVVLRTRILCDNFIRKHWWTINNINYIFQLRYNKSNMVI